MNFLSILGFIRNIEYVLLSCVKRPFRGLEHLGKLLGFHLVISLLLSSVDLPSVLFLSQSDLVLDVHDLSLWI